MVAQGGLTIRILKPQSLSLLHRCFERDHKAYLGVSVMAFMPLQSAPALLPEQEMWLLLPPLLDPLVPLDSAMPKIGGEFLVTGDACAPGGQPVTRLTVQARVGALSKSLQVTGRRQWVSKRIWGGKRASNPEPFVRQPISWAHTYGGPEFADNPVGCGIAAADAPAGVLQPLPCVEHPASLVSAHDKPADPASFAGIPPMWPQRKRFAGTYDAAWQKDEYPGPPVDFDWRYHGVASEDQWQPRPFAGNESVELVHLHPDFPRMELALPAIKPVIAAGIKGLPTGDAVFVEPQLTTLWFFPNQLRMVMIWHGQLQVDDEFGDPVELLFAAAEWADRPKPRQHYLDAIDARLDEQNGAMKVLDDDELLPEDLATPNESNERYKKIFGASGVAVENVQKKLKEAEQELAARLAPMQGAEGKTQAAIDAAKKEFGLSALSAQLPDDPKALIKLVEQLKQQMPSADEMKKKVAAREAARQQERRAELLAQGMDPAKVEAALKRPVPPASIPSAAEGIARLAQMPPSTDPAVPKIDTSKMLELARRSEETQAEMLRKAAHYQDPPAALDPATAASWRQSALAGHAQGRGFARRKLKAADFSGLDLSGADFSAAELDGANFTNTRLAGAKFNNASLAHAVLDGAYLDKADFSGANLGRARFARASCTGCVFTDANLHLTVFDEARLSNGNFANAQFIEVSAPKSNWTQADLSRAVFIKCALNSAKFAQAVTANASFIECGLDAGDFSRARLEATDFVTCVLDGANFDGCTAPNVRFVHGSSLRDTTFRGSDVSNASLRAMPLVNADFSGAKLDGSDLSEVTCPGGKFHRASLNGALLIKGQFQNAVFAEANLMQAIIQYAQLQGADLRNANLFASDLMRVVTDDATRMDAACMAKARTAPQRRPMKSTLTTGGAA